MKKIIIINLFVFSIINVINAIEKDSVTESNQKFIKEIKIKLRNKFLPNSKAHELFNVDIFGYFNDINDHDPRFNNITLLMWVIINNCKDIVELLINNGVDINAKDDFGLTALNYANDYNRNEIKDLLIQNGANISDIKPIGYMELLN